MGALSFLLGTVADLYMACFVIRLALYWHGADPRDPVATIVLRLTNPLAAPFRFLAKPSRRVETHVLVAFLVLECALVWLTAVIGCAADPAIFQIVAFGLIRALRLVLWFYLLAVVAWALMSWFSQNLEKQGILLHCACGYQPVYYPRLRRRPADAPRLAKLFGGASMLVSDMGSAPFRGAFPAAFFASCLASVIRVLCFANSSLERSG